MTPVEYAELAMRTAPDLGQKKNIIHATLGIVSEVGEIADMLKRNLAYGKAFDRTNLIEECGDVLWYVALLAEQHSWDFADLVPTHEYATEHVDVLVMDLASYGAIIGQCARVAAEHSLTPTYKYEVARLVTTIDKIVRGAGFSLEIAMQANILKLSRRYPGGFTEWRALNRDLVAEREVLEGGAQ